MMSSAVSGFSAVYFARWVGESKLPLLQSDGSALPLQFAPTCAFSPRSIQLIRCTYTCPQMMCVHSCLYRVRRVRSAQV